MLDWAGDIGGLAEAMLFLGHLTISPCAAIALKSRLVTSLVYYTDDGPDEKMGKGQD